MYFNLWSDENYFLKWICILTLLVLGLLITFKILIKAYDKYKTSYIERKKILNILDILNSQEDEKAKFNKVKDILWLNSSYLIENYIDVNHSEVLNLIKEEKYGLINKIIYNKLANNHD